MLKNELYASLNESLLGEHLSQRDLEMLIAHNNILTFKEGETILQQGTHSDGIYIIIQGSVVITAKILGEGTTNLETLGPGHFLGEVSYIENVPCATSMIASNNVQCMYISNIYIEYLSAYFPEIKYNLYKAICNQVCERIKEIHSKVTKFITNVDMTTRPFFSEIIQSLTKPSTISIGESGFDIKTLYKLPLFEIFNQEELSQLINHTILLKAPKNCTLIHAMEKRAACFIVIYGAVQSSVAQNSKVAKLSVIGPSTLFASISCIDVDSPYTITFTTCEEAILLSLSETELTYFQTNHPTIWYKLFDLICKSLVALEKSVDKLDIRLNIESYNR
jgi:CRP-like cAMP-binding protein